MSRIKVLLSTWVLLLAMLACNYVAPTAVPLPTSTPKLAPTTIIEPTAIATRSDLPRDEAAVPRVPVEQAKAALDSGAAIIVDVRAAQSYALEHIAGSISIPLSEIETNPTGLKLKKNQWIITYCT
jgi:rhodanese-like protein